MGDKRWPRAGRLQTCSFIVHETRTRSRDSVLAEHRRRYHVGDRLGGMCGARATATDLAECVGRYSDATSSSSSNSSSSRGTRVMFESDATA